MKICCKCKGKKELSEFYRCKRMRDGLNPMCKPCANDTAKKDFEKHREKRIASRRKWREENREHIREYASKWWKNSYKTKPHFKLAASIRNRFASAINGKYKAFSPLICGCTLKELKLHIEKQFKPGMSWANYSFTTWHIDHIKPLSSFDLSNKEDFTRAVHYTNLQPLWAKENIKKGAKYEEKEKDIERDLYYAY